MNLTVPGATLPMGGTTVITVQPTHRRRGVLNAMMQAHLKEIQARGEPLAGLWASESSIYGRFGYGLAAQGYELKLDGKAIQFVDDVPAGSIKLVEPEEARGSCPMSMSAFDRPGRGCSREVIRGGRRRLSMTLNTGAKEKVPSAMPST